jgi:integrase
MSKPKRIWIGDKVSIVRRGKKGIWTAEFFQDGKHCRRSLKTANLKEARRRALRLEVEVQDGTFQRSPVKRVTIAEAKAQYFAYLETLDRAHKTLVKYRGVLNVFEQFCTTKGVVRLDQVTVTLLDQYRVLRKPQCHSKTMSLEGVIIKQLFKWSKSRKLILENPIADYRIEKHKSEPRPGPSLEQVLKFLCVARGRLGWMLAVLICTGMRSGDLRHLRREDIDIAGNWIHIRSRPGAQTKSRLSRKVPIAARLRSVLETALKKSSGPWLFTAAPSRRYPNGGHWINTKRLNDDFLKLLKKLDMSAGRDGGYTIHSLRHSFETIAVHSGIPQRVIDTWLGHRWDRSMASVYYSLHDEESQRFMNMMPFGIGKPAAYAGDTEV